MTYREAFIQYVREIDTEIPADQKDIKEYLEKNQSKDFINVARSVKFAEKYLDSTTNDEKVFLNYAKRVNTLFKEGCPNAVKNQYTIELKPEIILIGDKTKKEEELWNIMYR